ncbi:hypothetical protein PF001_g10002 [Phytophthora fragariae]|uniref:Myb-like domain-containing protein n=1 Tax=Phytophthora fragariae TaxID=53985 RepID=A0A6A4DT36_9STRA|nr:hypothetical protein PF006_g7946 [Phytophthora fragariae]KAE9310825.1 hypothetical protein PF001_g10002 [Phytophthora fragariae]
MPPRPELAEPRKRKHFTENDDILLLKQVITDEPFRHGGGKVIDKWDKVAEVLLSSPAFSRETLAGKTAQNRTTLLLAKKKNAAEARLSGVEVTLSEKEALAEAEIAEAAGETVRKLAVERLKRPAAEDGEPTKGTKLVKIVGILAEYKEKELAAKKDQWEAERADRIALERGRLVVERQRQIDNQRLIEVLTVLAKK